MPRVCLNSEFVELKFVQVTPAPNGHSWHDDVETE